MSKQVTWHHCTFVRSLTSSHLHTKLYPFTSLCSCPLLGFRQLAQRGFVNGYVDGNLALTNIKSHPPHRQYIRDS